MQLKLVIISNLSIPTFFQFYNDKPIEGSKIIIQIDIQSYNCSKYYARWVHTTACNLKFFLFFILPI